MDISKKLVRLKVSDLIPYEKNPRKIPQEAIDDVCESYRQCGVIDPIEVDEENVILSGHTRRLAALEMGIDKVDCLRVQGLTDEQKRKYRVLANKTGEKSTWDYDLLAAEIDELDFGDYDFDFQIPDIDEGFSKEDTTEDDYEPNVPDEPKAKRGQIYQLGNHRLMCGDSTSDDVKILIDGASVGMVFTDPPYGMDLDTDYSSMKNHLDFAKEKHFTGGKKYEQGRVDEFHPEMVSSCLSIPAREVFLWGADYFAELLPNKNDGSWIVWDKRANGNDNIEEDYSSDKMYGSCFELCWSKKKHKRDIARVKWAGVFGTEQEFDHKRHHPTQKPIGLSQWFLKKYSKEDDIVVDLFGGSGSTLIACEHLDRICYMMELDPHYIDVIIDRWEQYTGKQAVLLNG